ncbi:DUF2887 domain-containing protein [Okeania sp. SIO1I7]|uniref:DUF2887 domain-containing protein n=1 Tax=Okeania sp. SIO1I7 TaxID=2607772 RepID=UPI0035C8C012
MTHTQIYEFTSREVKQLYFCLDGLFLPTDNNPNKSFYLVEVQFQPDNLLCYRLFAELFLFQDLRKISATYHVPLNTYTLVEGRQRSEGSYAVCVA